MAQEQMHNAINFTYRGSALGQIWEIKRFKHIKHLLESDEIHPKGVIKTTSNDRGQGRL